MLVLQFKESARAQTQAFHTCTHRDTRINCMCRHAQSCSRTHAHTKRKAPDLHIGEARGSKLCVKIKAGIFSEKRLRHLEQGHQCWTGPLHLGVCEREGLERGGEFVCMPHEHSWVLPADERASMCACANHALNVDVRNGDDASGSQRFRHALEHCARGVCSFEYICVTTCVHGCGSGRERGGGRERRGETRGREPAGRPGAWTKHSAMTTTYRQGAHERGRTRR